MLRKNKKLIILMLSIFSVCINVSLVSAVKTDCSEFAIMSYSSCDQGDNGFGIVDSSRGTNANKYSNFLSIEQQLAIIDKESLNTAMLNLKKYCCEKGVGGLSMEYDTCNDDKEFYNENVIDSPYLFDHLFDVIMRRLSGLTGENDIYMSLEMGSDDKGLEWRGWLNSQAENLSGANPQIIIDKYNEFWQPSPPQLKYDIAEKVDLTFREKSDDAILQYVSGQGGTGEYLGQVGTGESELIAEAIKNYDKWTLYDRYNNACAITQYLYTLLNLSVESEDKGNMVRILSQGTCDEFIKNQINNENAYVQIVILRSGNLFLQNYRQGYVSYLYGRAQNLHKIWRDSANKFLDVVRGVPHLVNTCVK